MMEKLASQKWPDKPESEPSERQNGRTTRAIRLALFSGESPVPRCISEAEGGVCI